MEERKSVIKGAATVSIVAFVFYIAGYIIGKFTFKHLYK